MSHTQEAPPIRVFTDGSYKNGMSAYSFFFSRNGTITSKFGPIVQAEYELKENGIVPTDVPIRSLDCNHAEFLAIIFALDEMVRIGAKNVEICTDSQTVIDILRYHRHYRYPDLYSIARKLEDKIPILSIVHVKQTKGQLYSHGNLIADGLAVTARRCIEYTLISTGTRCGTFSTHKISQKRLYAKHRRFDSHCLRRSVKCH